MDGAVVEIAYCPTFGDWLHWLEADPQLLMKEAGSPKAYAWAKALLTRWRDAGCPCPSEWPETKALHWLRPARSLWKLGIAVEEAKQNVAKAQKDFDAAMDSLEGETKE